MNKIKTTERADMAHLFAAGWQHDGAGRWMPPGDSRTRMAPATALEYQRARDQLLRYRITKNRSL